MPIAAVPLPPSIRHVHESPHVLFPEPIVKSCARRDNWIVQTVATGESMVEITLTLAGNTNDLPSSSSALTTKTATTTTTTSTIQANGTSDEKSKPPSSTATDSGISTKKKKKSSTPSSSAATPATPTKQSAKMEDTFQNTLGYSLPPPPGKLAVVPKPTTVPVKLESRLLKSTVSLLAIIAVLSFWPPLSPLSIDRDDSLQQHPILFHFFQQPQQQLPFPFHGPVQTFFQVCTTIIEIITSQLFSVSTSLSSAAAATASIPVSDSFSISLWGTSTSLHIHLPHLWYLYDVLLLRIVLLSFLCSSLISMFFLGGKTVVQESVAAIRGLGIQVTTVYNDGSRESHFLDASTIRCIIVNEGLMRCSIFYYLAVAVTGKRTLVLLFPNAKPRLPTVAYIYNTLVRVMCEPNTATLEQQKASEEEEHEEEEVWEMN